MPLGRGTGLRPGRPVRRWSATSRTTACCAGTRPPAPSACSGSRPATPTATRSTAEGRLVTCEHGHRRVDAHRARRHRSPCSPTATRASGSTAPTTSSCGPTARSGSPIPPTASTATTRATAPTARSAAATSTASTRHGRRARSSPTTSCGPTASPSRSTSAAVHRRQPPPSTSGVFDVARRRRALPAVSVFAECDAGSSTGIRLDDQGRVWAAADDGVHCYDPDGTLIGKLRAPRGRLQPRVRRAQAQPAVHHRHDLGVLGHALRQRCPAGVGTALIS